MPIPYLNAHVDLTLCLSSVCLPICLLSSHLSPVLLSGEAGGWTVVVYTVSKLQGHPFKAFLLVKLALWLLALLSLAKVVLTTVYWVCRQRLALRRDSERGLLALGWDIFLSFSTPSNLPCYVSHSHLPTFFSCLLFIL